MSEIIIRGAREHNLQDVHLTLRRNQLIVFTGVSGSGKSSLAFDTLFAEGQRRYVESLSSYARQFMGQLRKPDVDSIEGLSPAVSIEQKTAGGNPRSTVGTITEIHDYLRVLFARVGHGYCPKCGNPIAAQTRAQIIHRVMTLPVGAKVMLLAPMVRNQKGEFKDFFADMTRRGYVRARVDGQIVRLTDQLSLDRQMRHTIDIVVDRIKVDTKARTRVADAVEQALGLTAGSVLVIADEGNEAPGLDDGWLLSAHYSCNSCECSFEPPSPQLFSFNSPQGMCLDCDGLGTLHTFAPDLLVPDTTLSPRAGAILTLGNFSDMGKWRRFLLEGVAQTLGFSLDTPWKDLSAEFQKALMFGTGNRTITVAWKKGTRTEYHGSKWEGIIPPLLSKYRKTNSPFHRAMYEKYMRQQRCPGCDGARLNAQARHVRVAGKSLVELGATSIRELDLFFAQLAPGGPTTNVQPFSSLEWRIASEVVKEIRARLGFLLNVGLDYLALDRQAPTLSGGELQRIRLAGQIGSGLVGVLYVLDEPSIGLHPRDNTRLLATLAQLRDQGNTVIVVEHDEDTMRAADHLVDFGPGPGVRGGRVIAQGSLDDVMRAPESLTGQYLAGKTTIPVPARRRPVPAYAPANAPANVPTTTRAGGSKVNGPQNSMPTVPLRAKRRAAPALLIEPGDDADESDTPPPPRKRRAK